MADLNLNFSTLYPDKDLTNKGKWFSLGNNIKIKLASSSNYNLKYKSEALKNALQLDKNFLHKINTQGTKEFNNYTEAEIQLLGAFNLDITAKAIIKDWNGVKDGNNKVYPYSEQNAIKVLKQYPELLEKITALAENEKNFYKSKDIKKKL